MLIISTEQCSSDLESNDCLRCCIDCSKPSLRKIPVIIAQTSASLCLWNNFIHLER